MNIINNRDSSFESRRRKAIEERLILNQLRDETDFDSKDYLALIIAAFITLSPVVIGILFLYYGISMLVFG